MKTKNGIRRVVMLICISMALLFHFSFSDFFFFPFATLKAQTVVPVSMVNGDTLHLSNCHTKLGQIVFFDMDTSADNNYSTGFDGWVVVDYTDSKGKIVVNSTLADNHGTYLDVWDGTVQIEHRTGSCVFNDSILNGSLTIHLHTSPHDAGVNQQLNIVWRADSLSSYCHGLHSLNIHNIGNHSAIASWNSGVDSVYIEYGNGVRLVQGLSYYVLTGLDSLTEYTVTVSAWRDREQECCRLTRTFTTTAEAPPTCIDVTDLESPFVTCVYGAFHTPTDTIGIMPGRHTIMTDPDETDPETGNQLHVVPPGRSSSLRLGNAFTGAEAEGIICQMTVDTNIYDILLLEYAVVLQDPNHTEQSQPRFSFMLYDEMMNPVDASCGAVDFVANDDLGWNHAGNINLWKDWTTTGFNLSPYHGRTLNVVFVTRDCVGGEHFGYAYLVTDCFRKGLSAPQCGVDPPSSLTAPPGFNYEWFTSNDTTNIVSTEQTVQVNEPGATYTCIMSYIESPECQLRISVFAGSRFALADFGYNIYTSDCIHFNVAFENRSTVSPDGINPSPTGELCESFFWDFGNGHISAEYNPVAHYDSAGTYIVTLISSISGGQCQDTISIPITLPTFHIYEEHYTVCDSMTWWRTGETFYDDTVGALDLHPAADGCDTLYYLHLNVNRTPVLDVPRDTSCWSSPYYWRGQTLDLVPDTLTVVRMTDTLTNINGCDSVLAVDVLLVPKYSIEFDADADCHIKQYRLVGNSDAPYHFWTSSPIDLLLDGHYTDSMLTLSPSVITTYTYHAAFNSDGFCPTDKSISLEPVDFPNAQLRLAPKYMTLDNMEFEATDLAADEYRRGWTVTEYKDGLPGRTYHPESRRTISYYLTTIVDSVQVILDVSNGYCHDTASASIPLIRSTLYAPNIFTPDELTNNLFQIFATNISEVTLDIYNRNGLLVFHAESLDQPWNGTIDGRPCPQGAYAWHLRYRSDDFPDRWREAIGTILLIR